MVTDLICFSHLRWDFVWQRPQHLLVRLAAHYRVLFVEEPVGSVHITEPRLETQTYVYGPAQVTVLRLLFPVPHEQWIGHGDPLTQDLYSQLLTQYLQAKAYQVPMLWFYTPMAFEFARTIPYRLLIVDVMDQLSAFRGAPTTLIAREREVLKKADIVFTGGVSLYRDKLPFNSQTHLFPSGVEIEHFAQAASPSALPVPSEIAHLTGITLGYYGVIDERIDMALLGELATSHPEWNIVLVGPIIKIDPADLPRAANIHALGMRHYQELPAYLARFDVALIPFALNESTQFVSPTKTLEYMAAHKPIISTPIRDVIALYGTVVRIAPDAQTFADQIQEALAESPGDRRAKEDNLLALYSWDHIAQQMASLIDKRLAAAIRLRKQNLRAAALVVDSSSNAAAAAGDR